MNVLLRHALATRINHWLMAACMIAQVLTGFLPILGIKFAWVTLHWVSGVIFTASVLFHIIYALTRQDWRSMWIARGEFADVLSSLSGSIKALKVSPGKY
ncbi:MAG: cytochrome b/b6 domain-containing protein, partial [Gemmatimonadetes bacterium]|nr:cytochrome b/b6 domain-containing protein [Gemmatimonadota bacterium]